MCQPQVSHRTVMSANLKASFIDLYSSAYEAEISDSSTSVGCLESVCSSLIMVITDRKTIRVAKIRDSGNESPSVIAARIITPGGWNAVIAPTVAAERRRKAAAIKP